MISPDWINIRSFLEVARLGSLSAAARALGLTQPTVRRHIEDLSRALDVELFRRSATGMILTEHGERLVPAAEAMEKGAADFALRAAGETAEVSGTVRITASNIVSHYFLPQIVAEIRQAHPKVQIELAPNDTTENLLYREADIAIRMYKPTQLDLIAKRVATLPTGLYAAKSFLDRHGRPSDLDGALKLGMVGFDRNDLIIRVLAGFGLHVTRDFFPVRCDLQPVHWELVRAGCGFSGAMLAIGEGDPLVERILPEVEIAPLEVWLATPAPIRRAPRVAVVWDALAAAFARLEGRA